MPLLNHHEASLSFPPPKLDASSSSSHLFPLSPLIFDHDLFNDITLILAPPPQITPSSPPPPPLRPSPPDKPSSTHRNTNPSPRSAAALMSDLDKYCAGTTRPAKRVDGGGAVGRRLIRKDRHSKIHTAQGPRDRRMRLSLDVARKFFDLQDTLGFDKASKTVDWLLSCCKSSIMELTGSSSPRRYPAVLDHAAGNAKSESSTSSELEVISVSTNHSPPAACRAKRAAVRRRPRDAPSAHPPPSREKRQMARDRARERTKKKKMLRSRQFEEVGGGQRKHPASPPSPFETGKGSGTGAGTRTTKSSWDQLLVAEEARLSSCSPDPYKNVGTSAASPPAANIVGGSAPISIFNYDQNVVHNVGDIFSLVQEHQWDMIRPSGSAEEQRVLFADAQLQPFLWETFIN